jgi:hypothetical protein
VRTRPLAEVSARDLRPLLEEEAEHWAQELLWDYTDVSAAVASGLERRALTGFVLQDGPRSVAYCYYMLDAGRAIVGSLFAAAGFRGQGLEESLLDAVLEGAQSHPHNDRVECQTLFSTAPSAERTSPPPPTSSTPATAAAWMPPSTSPTRRRATAVGSWRRWSSVRAADVSIPTPRSSPKAPAARPE